MTMYQTSIWGAFDAIWDRKIPFFGVFFAIVFVTYGFLYAVDFIPEAPKTTDAPASAAATTTEAVSKSTTMSVAAATTTTTSASRDPYPNRIIIDKLGTNEKIFNPTTHSVDALDQYLLSGVVRYPDSATLTSDGTVFLFGHSSYLPKVINKNFQAFNGIQKLTWGDKIRLQSSDYEYVYRVDRVYQAKASDATVAISDTKATLTLATCNSFGTKDDRFIVEATLVDQYPLKS